MDVRLRSLDPSDRGAILGLLEGTGVFRPEEVGVAMELVDLALQNPGQGDYTFVVAEAEGTVAGYACWGATPCTRGTFDLYWMAAAPAFHGRGVASLLLRAAEEDMSRRGAKLCVIETSSLPQYEAARRFYLKSGYAEVARIPDFYGPGDARIIYTRPL
jgi:ribosomal protein S18 acetylase RimI-like enzyme